MGATNKIGGQVQQPQSSTIVSPTSTAPMAMPQSGGNVFNQASQGLTSAMYGAGQGMNYQPMMVSPAGVGSTGYRAATTGAGQLASTNLSPYMNPYTQNVIDTSMQDLERQRLMQQNQIGAQAQAAKAFGGSRQGVQEALTNEAFARQGGQLAANLRQAGFQNAQQMAQQDIASRMQASLANQAAMNQAGQFGASAANQAALQNQQAMMQAQQLNQAAGLQGAQQRLSAAGQMGNLANLGFGMGQQAQQMQAQSGALSQLTNQALIDAAKQQYAGYTGAPSNALSYLSQALGVTPNASTTTSSAQPGLFNYLALGASLL